MTSNNVKPHIVNDDEEEVLPIINENATEHHTQQRRSSYRSVGSADSAASNKGGGAISLDKRLSFIPNAVRRGSGHSSVDVSSDDSIARDIRMKSHGQGRESDGSEGNDIYSGGRRRTSHRLVMQTGSATSSNDDRRSSGKSSFMVKTKKYISTNIIGRYSDQSEDPQYNSDSTSNAHSMWADAALVAKQDEEESHGSSNRFSARVYRRYKVGDDVVINNVLDSASRLLNQYGFPPGKGSTIDEQRGPYDYVLAVVTSVHYGENKPYYTVQRFDTDEKIRSDSEFMDLIKPKALEVAKEFTHHFRQMQLMKGADAGYRKGHRYFHEEWFESCGWSIRNFFCVTAPTFFEDLRDLFRDFFVPCLNGEAPFQVHISLSAINVFVICHIWYLFIDQLRLAFFPASMDYGITVISLIVWFVLSLELIFEYSSRPYDYYELLCSRDSFAPSTRRFIGNFHLILETIALVAFVPEVLCVLSTEYSCSEEVEHSLLWAIREFFFNNSISGVVFMAVVRLRILGILRHLCSKYLRHDAEKDGLSNNEVDEEKIEDNDRKPTSINRTTRRLSEGVNKDIDKHTEENELTHATHIGTGMMVANSTLLFMLIMVIVVTIPLLTVLLYREARMTVPSHTADLLQEYLLIDPEDCTAKRFYQNSWIASVGRVGSSETVTKELKTDMFVIWAQLQDHKCSDYFSGNITIDFCENIQPRIDNILNSSATLSDSLLGMIDRCTIWSNPENILPQTSSKNLEIRLGEVLLEKRDDVTVQFNIQADIENVAIRVFTQQVVLVIFVLSMVAVLREDTNRLVIRPVQYMLKIVSRYKNNPMKEKKHRNDKNDENPGNYETEQLINAFTKITSLLRKCWGVAGANIITSNLKGTTEKDIIINPLIPGKCVHALFGFAAIKNFDHSLRSLESQIMILINIIASVLHGEVHRWGFGDSGQCNKNLGGLFLMVFKIGEDGAVQERLREAASVVFKTNESKKPKEKDSSRSAHPIQDQTKVVRSDLPLASLPGIDTFADRALIGMLKTFAGIHRDKNIERFVSENKLLLGYGTEDFEPDMIFGMDAGWAVEGAVGSEYKIDATYLSPHVNMASRMMSACKQYGVTILLSQAVENILSKHAKARLRHLDTVTVKGSVNIQRIYTYDARYKGVDFFLSNQSGASVAKDIQPTAELWNDDLDLQHMRRHVTEAFLEKFNEGRDAYLAGRWEVAVSLLKEADLLMVQNAVDSGYHDHELLDDLADALDNNTPDDKLDITVKNFKDELGDGPCQTLIAYMAKRNCIAPPDWKGWKALMSK